MNAASFLTLIVCMFAGYVLYPMVAPKLMESGIIENVEAKKKKDAKDGEDPAKDPATPPAPDSMAENKPDPEPVQPDPTPQPPKPDPVAEIKPDPAPVVPDPPKPTAQKMTDQEFLAAMKGSIQNGGVTEFKLDQVTDWRRVGEEEIDGETYEVGIAQFSANTILGPQKHDAKALFKDGKIVKWVWAVTNSDMK